MAWAPLHTKSGVVIDETVVRKITKHGLLDDETVVEKGGREKENNRKQNENVPNQEEKQTKMIDFVYRAFGRVRQKVLDFQNRGKSRRG